MGRIDPQQRGRTTRMETSSSRWSTLEKNEKIEKKQIDQAKMSILGKYDNDTAFINLSDFDLRCSEVFNFNMYKLNLKVRPNSQGMEQLHALIEKCSDSLRLMSY